MYGAPDQKAGAVGTLYDIHADGRLNHQFEVTGGVREEECVALLRDFFRAGARSRCQILDEVWPVFLAYESTHLSLRRKCI